MQCQFDLVVQGGCQFAKWTIKKCHFESMPWQMPAVRAEVVFLFHFFSLQVQ